MDSSKEMGRKALPTLLTLGLNAAKFFAFVRQRTELCRVRAYSFDKSSATLPVDPVSVLGRLEDIRATTFHFQRISYEPFNNYICVVCRVNPHCL
jgi:hypothetical protein